MRAGTHACAHTCDEGAVRLMQHTQACEHVHVSASIPGGVNLYRQSWANLLSAP